MQRHTGAQVCIVPTILYKSLMPERRAKTCVCVKYMKEFYNQLTHNLIDRQNLQTLKEDANRVCD